MKNDSSRPVRVAPRVTIAPGATWNPGGPAPKLAAAKKKIERLDAKIKPLMRPRR